MRFLCTMHVFKVRASSTSPRPNFIFVAASVAELARGEQSCTQSITHSLSLFDAPGTKLLALWNIFSVLKFFSVF